jgi:transposase
MYIRKATRKYKDKLYTNHLLVESIHTPKGPRQKVICSLGDLSPRPREAWLKLAHKMETALAGQTELFEVDPEVGGLLERARKQNHRPRRRDGTPPHTKNLDWVTVETDGVEIEDPREAGPVQVGYAFWRRLGFDEVLAKVGFNQQTRTLTCAMALNRLVCPGSEHAMPGWIRRTALEDILSVEFKTLTESALYRTLDRLHPERGRIESALCERERTLFNLDQTIYLYDLTSTYFEGQALKNPKAKHGYSRDKRPDCKQVVVGLVVNRDGFPQAHEVFEGNRPDRTTLTAMLDLLDTRVGLKAGQTVVVDRGMAFDDNLAELKSRKLHYVVASRQSERDTWLAEFEDLSGFEEVLRLPSPRNPFQKKSQLKVKLKRPEEGTYVLCISSERKEKDRAIREKQEARLQAALKKLEARVKQGQLVKPTKIGEAIGRLKERYPRVARYYEITHDTQTKECTWTLNQEKHHTAEQLDGSYLLKTDRTDLSAEDIWHIYSLLTRAEEAFRSMKSPLAERPIFHQLERRVETHIFLCVLAYHLLVAIEKTLRDKGVHTSWGTVRDLLKTHQVATIALPADQGAVLRIRKGTVPEPEHKELYTLLDVPERLIRPKKIWTQSPKIVTKKISTN